jgi:hypothetical protein
MSEFMKISETLIPLSHLALDLEPPAIGGWHHYLAECNIKIIDDDLGRPSVSRSDARRLLTQKREAEARAREVAAANERQAVEADRQWRAGLPRGAAWWEVPDGVHPATAMLQQAKDAEPRRRSVLEDALAGGETTMYILDPQPAFEDE